MNDSEQKKKLPFDLTDIHYELAEGIVNELIEKAYFRVDGLFNSDAERIFMMKNVAINFIGNVTVKMSKPEYRKEQSEHMIASLKRYFDIYFESNQDE